jgi:FixJ family two-component response regulator
MEKYTDILAIDDEPIILDAVSRICEDHQLTVDAVTSVELAEEKLMGDGYRLILCDLMMPNKDGFQLLRQMEKKNIDIPVIIMTGFSTTENAVKALGYGAIDFISKPFTEDELIASVQRGIRYVTVTRKEQQPTIPSNYFCLGISSWLSKQEDGTVVTGITSKYLMMIEGLLSIDLLHPGHQLVQGLTCAKLVCNELTHNYIAPISGRILDYNMELENSIDLLKTNAYDSGWIYRVLPAAMEDEMKYLISCR